MFFETRARPRKIKRYAPISASTILSSPQYVSADSAMRNSDIRTALTIISSDVARVTFHSPDANINKLLNAPSRMTGRFSFFQSMVAQMLIDGNAYALRRKDAQSEFWEFVKPSGVSPKLADDGQSLIYEFRFGHPEEQDLTDEHAVSASDVIHFRLMGVNGGLLGRSPLEALQSELSLQSTSTKLALSVFSRAITPTILLKAHAKLKDESKQQAKKEFIAANTGEHAGEPLIMDENFDFQQLEVKSDVATLLDSTNWTRQQIAKVFMIPVDSMGSESQHSNIDQIRGQYNTALGRYIAPIVDELALKLGVKITPNVREAIDLDGSQIEARTAELVKNQVISPDVGLEILRQSHSDLVTDEVLNAVTLQRLKGGDSTDDGNGSTDSTENS